MILANPLVRQMSGINSVRRITLNPCRLIASHLFCCLLLCSPVPLADFFIHLVDAVIQSGGTISEANYPPLFLKIHLRRKKMLSIKCFSRESARGGTLFLSELLRSAKELVILFYFRANIVFEWN